MDSGLRQYVMFRLGAEEYGLPIEKIRSIIRYEEPTPVPRAPESVEGVINLRGQVIPIVDLGKRLLGRTFEPQPTARVIVAEAASGIVGLLVDAAHEVSAIAESDIRPAPENALSPDTAEAFEGVASRADRLVILLDLDHAMPRMEPGSLPQEGDLDV